MRPADSRNPEGFLELIEMNRIDDRLVHESGFSNHLVAEEWLGLRATSLRRFSRLVTIFRMKRLLKKLSDGADRSPWGFKQMPHTFYWWKREIPKVRIIGIYRDPRTCAASIHRTFGRFTFRQALLWWTRGNQELLFHLSQSENLLVRFEDLIDPAKRQSVIESIVLFCGGDVSRLAKVLEDTEASRPTTNRSEKSALAVEMLPLPQETEAVYLALEKYFHQSHQ